MAIVATAAPVPRNERRDNLMGFIIVNVSGSWIAEAAGMD